MQKHEAAESMDQLLLLLQAPCHILTRTSVIAPIVSFTAVTITVLTVAARIEVNDSMVYLSAP